MTEPDATRILLEIVNGIPPAEEDSAEEAALRREMASEVAAIRENGGSIDIPTEIP